MTARVRAQVGSHPRSAMTVVLVAAAMIMGLGVRHVASRREVVRVGYELSAAAAELRHLEEAGRRLRLERSVLTGPERIDTLAAGLGLAPPLPEQVRIVGRAGAR
jgi:cell division protein FtsL